MEPNAGAIVQACVSMLCQIGTYTSWVATPLLRSVVQVYEMMQAAVVVVTRRSWGAVGVLVRRGPKSGRWTPPELDEFVTNLAVLLAVLGLTWWVLKRSSATRATDQESPGSSSVVEVVELGGAKGPWRGSTTLPDTSEYTRADHIQAMRYSSFTNDALKGVCRSRGVSSSGRKAVLVDTLVRSEPGMRTQVQRTCRATKTQLNRIEEVSKRQHIVVPERVRMTAATAAEWIQEHAPIVPS